MAEMNGSRKHISISVPDQPDTMSPHIKSAEELRVIGFNLSDFSRTMQFAICVAGVFVFYLVYGYMQVIGKFNLQPPHAVPHKSVPRCHMPVPIAPVALPTVALALISLLLVPRSSFSHWKVSNPSVGT